MSGRQQGNRMATEITWRAPPQVKGEAGSADPWDVVTRVARPCNFLKETRNPDFF